ncbi:MAG: hypothetical protein F9K16_04690 [Thermoanaerobaculia bacterium]|nr:MAG: hypothetical protein F9K16_04690 [Thermoanaerobaculia bacterium]
MKPFPSADRDALPDSPRPVSLHPAWLTLIRLCREIGHGEIERLRIEDGLPVLAEVTRKKVRLT